MDCAISVSDYHKTFAGRAALKGVSLQIMSGEMVALLGASGSGKSTLLRQIAGLQKGDAGSKSEIRVRTRVMQSGGRLSSEVRAIRSEVGFVFQQFNLVERLPVITNVLAGRLHAMPSWRSLTKWFTAKERQTALQMLATVGIAEQAYKRAGQLSGGQQQRAAIARALVQGAKILLADEPIASLDPESARKVMELLRQINREHGVTVVVSLHQLDHALRYCPRTVALRGGEVVYDGRSADLTPQRLKELYGSEHDIPVGDLGMGQQVIEHARQLDEESAHAIPAAHQHAQGSEAARALRMGGAGA